MQLIPALDVLGDDAVRLERGDYDRVLFRQPLEEFMGRLVATQPALIHIVDLQGARDGALRPEVIERCRSAAQGTPLQVSGGIRTLESAKSALVAGASRVIVGTALWSDDTALGSFSNQLGDQLVAALDIKDGQLAIRGWLSYSSVTLADALERCVAAGIARLHVTAIDRDGTMSGPDLARYELVCSYGLPVVAAGGVRDDQDIAALEKCGCEAAVMGVGYLKRIGL